MGRRKIITLVLIICFICSISFSVLANDVAGTTFVGYGYDLYNMDKLGDLSNIQIVNQNNEISMSFVFNGEVYNIVYDYSDFDYYEGTFVFQERQYYSLVSNADSEYVGMIRDVSGVTNSNTHQFGFIITQDTLKLSNYIDSIDVSKESSDLNKAILNNTDFLTSEPTSVNTRGITKVGCYSPLAISFGEVWGLISGTTSYKTCKVTQYNIVIGVWGDGCYLRQCNNSGYSKTLWSTPLSPPRGLQSVNQTFNIPFEYTGVLEVTVTGLYDIYNIPLPIPFIYADGVSF